MMVHRPSSLPRNVLLPPLSIDHSIGKYHIFSLIFQFYKSYYAWLAENNFILQCCLIYKKFHVARAKGSLSRLLQPIHSRVYLITSRMRLRLRSGSYFSDNFYKTKTFAHLRKYFLVNSTDGTIYASRGTSILFMALTKSAAFCGINRMIVGFDKCQLTWVIPIRNQNLCRLIIMETFMVYKCT